MVNYPEILRLASQGNGQRQIAVSVHSSHHTVREVLDMAKKQGVHWPLEESVSNEQLSFILFPNRKTETSQYLEPNFAYIHTELSKPKVSLTLLCDEYRQKAESLGKKPYMTTQFGDKYRKWAQVTKATMRIHHKPGMLWKLIVQDRRFPFTIQLRERSHRHFCLWQFCHVADMRMWKPLLI